jgi:hypothetical protein
LSDDARADTAGRCRPRRRWLVLALALAAVALVAADLTRPPSRQTSSRVLTAALSAYRRTASPLLARIGIRCRFEPTCSRYADVCVRRFGAGRGSWMAVRRLLRCGPWTPAGTVDPPPATLAPDPPSQ